MIQENKEHLIPKDMDMNDYIIATEEFLDTIDIASYMAYNDTIEELMYRLETVYNGTPKIQAFPFDGCLFSWMNGIEFTDYLESRYGDKISVYEISKHPYNFKRN